MSVEELTTYVLYDIPDDGVRTKIADVCKDYGLERVQFSAFCGLLTRNKREELFLRLGDVLGERPGKILLQPVCEKDLRLGLRVENDDAAPSLNHPKLTLRVSDLKQYEYCPRVVYYQYVMPVERKATFKMEHGKSAEMRLAALEQRRTLQRYGLPDGTRHFHVWLTSERLGLSGKLDVLIESSTGWHPVDFKETTGPARPNHFVQLCGYALLVEEACRQPVARGFIYLIPTNSIEPVEMTDELRTNTVTALDRIREMILSQRVPEATEIRARCTDCEYRNYCGDVF